MSAPTKNAAPPLPIGQAVAAMPKKKPYPFWLGGTALTFLTPLPHIARHTTTFGVTRMVLTIVLR